MIECGIADQRETRAAVAYNGAACVDPGTELRQRASERTIERR